MQNTSHVVRDERDDLASDFLRVASTVCSLHKHRNFSASFPVSKMKITVELLQREARRKNTKENVKTLHKLEVQFKL